MKIKKSIYEQILKFCPVVPPETGGIIGSHSTVVDTVAFDDCIKIMQSAVYIPDIARLNRVLYKWQKNKISFCGMFHSHMKDQETLSSDDIEYIKSIFFSLPHTISKLYFPIVIPNSHIIPYKAINQNHNIIITSDKIDLVP